MEESTATSSTEEQRPQYQWRNDDNITNGVDDNNIAVEKTMHVGRRSGILEKDIPDEIV